ncbi:hypothetical protein [Phytoactinopolyspora limicola]|uniref:hypothetical protein n=1 Tax=Phytoactinopolyspora limicola TaxID=2715536 RepID=UPI001A9CA197|nr:hypothetical protein [Phytoactinopolyspora limicola]
MKRQKRYLIPLITAVMMLVVAACGGDDTDDDTDDTPVVEPTEDTTPELTAPPQPTEPTEEEIAEEEIQAAFDDLIAKMDHYYANVSELAGAQDEAWAREVMADWPLTYLGAAETELEGFVHGWARHEADQIGETNVLGHQVDEFETIGLLDTATSTACVDRDGLEYVDFDGEPVDIPQPTTRSSRWEMTWHYIEQDDDGAWLLEEAVVEPDEDC